MRTSCVRHALRETVLTSPKGTGRTRVLIGVSGCPTPPRRRPRDPVTGQISVPPTTATETQAADTLAELRALSRAPFRRVLSRYLEAMPDLEALAAQAEQYPDRWAQGLAIAGRLAGYSDRTEVDHTGTIHHVHHLSDAELVARIAELDAQLDTQARSPRSLSPVRPKP